MSTKISIILCMFAFFTSLLEGVLLKNILKINFTNLILTFFNVILCSSLTVSYYYDFLHSHNNLELLLSIIWFLTSLISIFLFKDYFVRFKNKSKESSKEA